jgi:TorA maturation chaperone TorD
MVELNSIAKGIETCDYMVKAAQVELIRSSTVCPGKYLILIAGDTGDVRAAMKEGLAAGADHDDVVWEYRRLFVGPGHLPAPPWGSVYTDRECVVFGESTLALRAWMRAVGVERLADERTPEDHIGLMLALLSFLAAERPELVDDYLRDHLLTWAPHYLEALEEAAEQPFYTGLARLTRLTLAGLQRERGLTVELPRFYR